MNSPQLAKKVCYVALAACMFCMLYAAMATAQDTSTTTVKHGTPSHEVNVEHGEVVYVSGNDVVIKMEDGEIRNFKVPDDASATVNGKEISVHDLQPGTKLEHTITTTTTPTEVITVRTIKGKVWHVNKPVSVVLDLGNGQHKMYKIPKGQKFMVDGQEKTAFDLKKGMNITATVITTEPVIVAEQQRKTTGSLPPPPSTPPLEGAMLVEDLPAAPSEVASAEPAQLPHTGSELPLLGLLGAVLSLSGIGLRVVRNKS